MIIEPIAYLQNDYDEKFGVPRQSLLCNAAESYIIFEPQYSVPEAVRGIEEYSHLWLIWEFDRNEDKTFSPTVRPPRLGGNTRVSVFAPRSPGRPNRQGVSCGKGLEPKILEGRIIIKVSGADMVNGTPIYDIKPYIPYADAHPEASGSFAQVHSGDRLKVEVSDKVSTGLSKILTSSQLEGLMESLALDPRPSYIADSDREYRMKYAGIDISFEVQNNILKVKDFYIE